MASHSNTSLSEWLPRLWCSASHGIMHSLWNLVSPQTLVQEPLWQEWRLFLQKTKVHDDPIHANSTDIGKTCPCIHLEQVNSGGFQCNCKFLNLNTGHVVEWKQFKKIPTSSGIIQWIEALEHCGCMPMQSLFANCNGSAWKMMTFKPMMSPPLMIAPKEKKDDPLPTTTQKWMRSLMTKIQEACTHQWGFYMSWQCTPTWRPQWDKTSHYGYLWRWKWY